MVGGKSQFRSLTLKGASSLVQRDGRFKIPATPNTLQSSVSAGQPLTVVLEYPHDDKNVRLEFSGKVVRVEQGGSKEAVGVAVLFDCLHPEVPRNLFRLNAKGVFKSVFPCVITPVTNGHRTAYLTITLCASIAYS